MSLKTQVEIATQASEIARSVGDAFPRFQAQLEWALSYRQEHQKCGPLVMLNRDAFVRGDTDRLKVRCPEHGVVEGPEWE